MVKFTDVWGNILPLVFRSKAPVTIIILTWCCTRTQDILPHSMTSMKSPEDTDWDQQTSFCTHLIAHCVLWCVNVIVRNDVELTKSQIRTFFLCKILTICTYLKIFGLFGICYSLLVALECQSEGNIPVREGCAVSGWTRTIIPSDPFTCAPSNMNHCSEVCIVIHYYSLVYIWY
jgi:hypothetical protein